MNYAGIAFVVVMLLVSVGSAAVASRIETKQDNDKKFKRGDG